MGMRMVVRRSCSSLEVPVEGAWRVVVVDSGLNTEEA